MPRKQKNLIFIVRYYWNAGGAIIMKSTLWVVKKLFGFQNKYMIVLNNFLKRLKHLISHMNEFCSQHIMPLKNTCNQHLLLK